MERTKGRSSERWGGADVSRFGRLGVREREWKEGRRRGAGRDLLTWEVEGKEREREEGGRGERVNCFILSEVDGGAERVRGKRERDVGEEDFYLWDMEGEEVEGESRQREGDGGTGGGRYVKNLPQLGEGRGRASLGGWGRVILFYQHCMRTSCFRLLAGRGWAPTS